MRYVELYYHMQYNCGGGWETTQSQEVIACGLCSVTDLICRVKAYNDAGESEDAQYKTTPPGKSNAWL